VGRQGRRASGTRDRARAPALIGARRIASIVAVLIVAVGVSWYAFRDTSFSETLAALRAADPLWLIPAAALYAAHIGLRSIRWGETFTRQTRPPRRALTRALILGCFFNSVLPFRAGEAARVVDLHRSAATSRSEAAATILAERVHDVASLLLLFAVLLPWLPQVNWLTSAAWIGLALLLALCVIVLATSTPGRGSLARLPFGRHSDRLRAAGGNLTRGLESLRRPTPALTVLVWTILSWLPLAGAAWAIAAGLDIDVGLSAALLVVVATGLAMIVPAPPANLGVFEAACVVALDAYGVEPAKALSFALVFHALNVVPFLIAGPLLLARRKRAVAPLEQVES
jgi:uncharacterized protein (TIRG00374 family)